MHLSALDSCRREHTRNAQPLLNRKHPVPASRRELVACKTLASDAVDATTAPHPQNAVAATIRLRHS